MQSHISSLKMHRTLAHRKLLPKWVPHTHRNLLPHIAPPQAAAAHRKSFFGLYLNHFDEKIGPISFCISLISVSFLGGRAALSAIPSALKRWNEESCVIDGDSMHNCVTALKPTILEVCNLKIISLKHRAKIYNAQFPSAIGWRKKKSQL